MQTREVKDWTMDFLLSLQECYECTDWKMFQQSCDDLDELVDVTCSYVAFCRDTIIQTRGFKFILTINHGSTK